MAVQIALMRSGRAVTVQFRRGSTTLEFYGNSIGSSMAAHIFLAAAPAIKM